MEILGETPPPLPPKTKKPVEFQPTETFKALTSAFANETTVSIAPQNGHETGSLKIVNNRHHDKDSFAPPQVLQLSENGVTGSQLNKVVADDRLLITADKKNGCDSASRSTVSSPKIITWGATKKPEVSSTSEDLYENVSKKGMNFFENHVTNKTVKSEATTCWDAGGKRKTPKIEVRQEDNKTVVKISIKDTPTAEEEMNAERFSLDEKLYENGFISLTSNVVYANCDKSEDGGNIYENVNVLMEDERCYENLSNNCYENVDTGERFYANVSENVNRFNRAPKKELITEANYGNLNGDVSRCDQVCNNREFEISKNNVASVVGKTSGPPAKNSPKREDEADESYKNDKTDYHIYSNENFCRNGQTSDETAEKCEGRKTVEEKRSSVVEVFLHKSSTVAKVDKPEAEYTDDNSSGDPFDSGTCSDVDSLPNFLQNKKGNVIVTIKSLNEDKTDDKKLEFGHKRAESLTSSGLGVDSEESDDEKSNISCDSLNSNDPYPQSNSEDHGYHTPNSEDKTGSPIDQIEYENVIKRPSDDQDKNDIIQQVANVSQKIKNLRMESTGVFLAKLIEPSEFEEYENVYMFNQLPKFYKKKPPPPPPPAKPPLATLQRFPDSVNENSQKTLPKNLLRDIRSRNVCLSSTYPSGEKQEGGKTSIADVVSSLEGGASGKNQQTLENSVKQLMVEERTYEERKSDVRSVKINKICAMEIDTDKFYKFHLSENVRDSAKEDNAKEEETFAGIKDYLCSEKPAAITSAKGTIRGVKNRVKAGIATFLQLHENKSYKDRDAGKVVVYTTTMGIVRETYHKCLKVKQILRTLMVKFEERDVFMSSEAQDEIRDRMKCSAILVPQVFVEGQHIGDAETIERLNEMGELRTILKPYKSADACSTCKVCGGYRLLPCRVCKGSKKSIHRNHFTAEFVALKCMNCDQVGLTKCHAC